MPRFRLTVEYLGTRYSGWQVQANARTVAGEIGQAVRAITGRDRFDLHGSGRTDAGVHALQQIAHLDVATTLAPDALKAAINERVPHDIVVADLRVVSHRFHARHDAVRRSYLYQVSTRPVAFGKALVWWVKDPLDVTAMSEAAAAFEGMHDFRSFTDADPEEKSTKVHVDRVTVVEASPFVLVRVTGSHFLWKMVRRMVGVLVDVGRRRLPVNAVTGMLQTRSPLPATLTAPPSGLFLERVFYADDEPERALTPVLQL